MGKLSEGVGKIYNRTVWGNKTQDAIAEAPPCRVTIPSLSLNSFPSIQMLHIFDFEGEIYLLK